MIENNVEVAVPMSIFSRLIAVYTGRSLASAAEVGRQPGSLQLNGGKPMRPTSARSINPTHAKDGR